jgi:hypothetical protein
VTLNMKLNNCTMKKRIIAVSLLSLVLILSSCQKIKDLITKKVDAVFVVTLPVAITAPLLKSTSSAFLSTNTLDPLDDDDLASYKDKIKGFEVTGIEGIVSELSTDVTLTDVKLQVKTSANSAEWNFANLPLSNGTLITFDNTGGQFAKINAILDEQTIITVTLSGNSTQTGVTFNFLVKFTTEASVKVL